MEKLLASTLYWLHINLRGREGSLMEKSKTIETFCQIKKELFCPEASLFFGANEQK